MADSQSPHALDLQTSERLSVRIDGAPYTMRTEADLGLGQYRQIAEIYNRCLAIEYQAVVSPADEIEMMTLLGRGAHIALVDVPPDVVARMGYAQRSALFATFTKLSGTGLKFLRATRTEAPTAPATAPAPSAGTKSSPESSASTAVPRPSGRRKSRSA